MISRLHRKSTDLAAGETMAELAAEYECGEATIFRALRSAA
jgi:hypothetical protein